MGLKPTSHTKLFLSRQPHYNTVNIGMQYQLGINFSCFDGKKTIASKRILEIHCLLGYNVKCTPSTIDSGEKYKGGVLK